MELGSLAIALIIIAIVILVFYKDPLHLFVVGRQKDIYECGYETQPRGWYDFRKQGVKNDYCSYVGDNPAYFACQFGDPAKLTDRLYANAYDPNAPHDPFVKGDYTCKWPAPK